MGKKQRRRDDAGQKAIMIIILSIIVIIAVIAGAVRGFRSNSPQGGDNHSVSDNITVEENEEDKAQTEEAVNSLVRQYRAALASADIDTIAKLYQVDQVENADTITATSRVITGYLNTQCYIRSGLEEGSKVVFIYDDLQLADIDVLAPNLSYIYVRRNDDGTYYIDPGTYNPETMMYEYNEDILNYINNELSSDTQISSLYSDVNSRFEQLCSENEQLQSFMDKLSQAQALHNASEAESSGQSDAGSADETQSGESASDGQTDGESSGQTETDSTQSSDSAG